MTNDEIRLAILKDIRDSVRAAVRAAVLKDIDECFIGAEKMILAQDDPSGCRTEYVLDSEAFRENLQKKIDELEVDSGN